MRAMHLRQVQADLLSRMNKLKETGKEADEEYHVFFRTAIKRAYSRGRLQEALSEAKFISEMLYKISGMIQNVESNVDNDNNTVDVLDDAESALYNCRLYLKGIFEAHPEIMTEMQDKYSGLGGYIDPEEDDGK